MKITERKCKQIVGGAAAAALLDVYKRQRLVWLTMDGDEKIYPEFFRTELKQPCGFVKHMCTDDRR